jgi:N-acetylneuraminic acid mutarotase
MDKKNTILEINLKNQSSVDWLEEVRNCPLHLEIQILGNIYQSKVFSGSSAANTVLMRAKVSPVALPFTRDTDLTLRLFAHLPHKVIMVGLQHYNLFNARFPIKSSVPILRKNNTSKVLSVDMSWTLEGKEPAVEEVISTRQTSTPRPLQVPFIQESLLKQAADLKSQNLGTSPEFWLKGIGLAILKATKDHFPLLDPISLLLDDYSSNEVLGDNYLYVQTPDELSKKNVYLNLSTDSLWVAKPAPANSLPTFYHHAMCSLPNGQFLVSGGNSKDGIITFQGIHAFNPRTGQYIKITEIPFLLHKHEMHYYKGFVYVFGGCDSKKDSANNQNSGLNASTIHKLDLSTLKWTKAEKLIHKFNDRCASIIHKDMFIVNKGMDGLEVFSLDGKVKGWKVISDKNKKTLFAMPSAFFEVEGELYLLCKKSKEDPTKHNLYKITVNETISYETELIMESIECLALGGVRTVEGMEKFDVVTKAYILDSNLLTDTKVLKFKNKKLQDSGESSTRVQKLELKTFFDSRIKPTPQILGKVAESSIVQVKANKQGPPQRTFFKLDPSTLQENSCEEMVRVHKGIHHKFVPLTRGPLILAGYFENTEEDKYRLNDRCLLIRSVTCTKVPSYLPIPTVSLNTVGHSTIIVDNLLFFIGGLAPADRTTQFSAEELKTLKPIPEKLTAVRTISVLRLNDWIWKPVESLPKGLFGAFLFSHKGKVAIIGGKDDLNQTNLHVHILDLKTLSLKKTNVRLNLNIKPGENLEAFRVANTVYVGVPGQGTCVIYRLEEDGAYTIKSNFLEDYSVLSSDLLENGYKTLLNFKLTKNTENTTVYEKIVNADILGLEVEKSLEDLKKYMVGGPTTIVAETFEGTPEVFSQFKSDHDLFALDEIELSRNQNDVKKFNNHAILYQNNSDCMEDCQYYFSEDRVLHINKSQTKSKSQRKWARNAAVVSLPHGKLLITGGEVAQEGKLIATNETWYFSPISQSWTAGPKMKFSRINHGIIRKKNFVYCFGGQTSSSGGYLKECERLNILTGEWEVISNMSRPLSKMGVGGYLDKLYFFGGETEKGELSDKVFLFDLPTQTFEPVTSYKLPAAQRHLIVVEVLDGLITVGGECQAGPNMHINMVRFSKGHDQLDVKAMGVTMYPHVRAENMYVNGQLLLVGGNDLNQSENIKISSMICKEVFSFRNLPMREFYLSPVQNEMSLCDNFLHDNPYFDKLYIFGLDTKKEIWR